MFFCNVSENYFIEDRNSKNLLKFAIQTKLTIPMENHCASKDSKQLSCLLQLGISVIDNRVGRKIGQTFSEMKESDDDKLNHFLVLLEEISSLCSHKKERTAREQLARKYVSEVKQWQPIVEKGLSFKQQN